MSNTYTDLIQRRATNKESDECYTPSDQIAPLLEYLDKEKTYYEKPAQRKQRLKNAAIRREAKRNRDEMLRPQRGFVSKSRKR